VIIIGFRPAGPTRPGIAPYFMWSYIKIPYLSVDLFDGLGVVTIDQYHALEGQVVRQGEVVISAHTKWADFEIISNYHGKILKAVLSSGMLVAYRDPVATMELLEDPDHDKKIETYRVSRLSTRSPEEGKKYEVFKHVVNELSVGAASTLQEWSLANKNAIENYFGRAFYREIEASNWSGLKKMIANYGVQID
jgi:pyruvate/2-oxoglutarate dehydrogenase complex dihydrolipoamide acyltransferase (E2) component